MENAVFEQNEGHGASPKNSGVNRSRLVANEFHRESTIHGFTNFFETAPLDLVWLMISRVATDQWDRAAWLGRQEHDCAETVAMTHGHQHSATSRFQQGRVMPEMWSAECGRLGVSLNGTRDAAANYKRSVFQGSSGTPI